MTCGAPHPEHPVVCAVEDPHADHFAMYQGEALCWTDVGAIGSLSLAEIAERVRASAVDDGLPTARRGKSPASRGLRNFG